MGLFNNLFDGIKNKINGWMKPGGWQTLYDDGKNFMHNTVGKIKNVFDTVNNGRKFIEKIPIAGDLIKPISSSFDTADNIISGGTNLMNNSFKVGDDLMNGRNINSQDMNAIKFQGYNVLDNLTKLKTNLLNRRQQK